MDSRTENAILRNVLAETLRVYEHGGAPTAVWADISEPTARRGVSSHGFGTKDVKTEHSVLRHLLAITVEAYEDRLNAFQAEKELVRLLLAATSDLVWTTDESGAVTSLNRSAEELTGWREAEARGHGLAEVLRLVDDDGAAVGLDLGPCLTASRRVELPRNLRLAHRDGWARPVEGHAAAIHDRHRHVLGTVVILRLDRSRSANRQ